VEADENGSGCPRITSTGLSSGLVSISASSGLFALGELLYFGAFRASRAFGRSSRIKYESRWQAVSLNMFSVTTALSGKIDP
jgi:hypothetical protein